MKLVVHLLLFFLHEVTCSKVSYKPGYEKKAVLEILNSPDYNKDIRPSSDKKEPTVIRINLAIRKLDYIDDLKMEYTTQLQFRQTWQDDRLRFQINDNSTETEPEYAILDEVSGMKLWTPDLFFRNEARSFYHDTMKSNSYKRVQPSGKVTWSTRVTVTFSCPMDFRRFPFDLQICSMSVGSFTLTMKNLIAKWDEEDPIQFMVTPRFPRFKFTKYDIGNCSSDNVAGKYSCIYIDLHLQRQAELYITMIYMPTTLCVILSWVSLWLGPLISARLSLTVTLLLTMATLTQGVNQNLPQVSYTKALDVWTGWCLTFGAFAILQVATVAHTKQWEMESEKKSEESLTSNNLANGRIRRSLSVKIDIASRLIFPLLFFLFTIIYILVYVVANNHVDRTNFITDQYKDET